MPSGTAIMAQQADLSDSFVVFMTDFPDVPVIPGMIQVADSTVSFDATGGRFVQSVVIGRPSVDPWEFIASTLPSLGWAADNDVAADGKGLRFFREGEQLVFQVVDEDVESGLVITVTLLPQQKSFPSS